MAVLHQYDYLFATGMLFAFLDAWNIGANDVANSFATHCIIGGVIGVGIASLGADEVVWGWNGVSQVFAAWVIAPAIVGAFGAIVFTICKCAVLKRKNPLRAGLIIIPVFFAVTTGVLTMVVVWKGAPSLKLDNWGTGRILGCIFGVAGGSAVLCTLFFAPFLHRKLVMDDWQLKWYHAFYGPLLSRRGEVPPMPQHEQKQVVQDYYSGHKTRAQLEESRTMGRDIVDDIESSKEARVKTRSSASSDDISAVEPAHPPTAGALRLEAKDTAQVGPWYAPRNLVRKAKYYFFRGVDIDVVAEQKKKSILAGDLEAMHARVEHFDNKTEHLLSFLQVLTAATVSFAHGANDVSNAIGPLAAIYLIWNTGKLSSKSPVPVWVLQVPPTAPLRCSATQETKLLTASQRLRRRRHRHRPLDLRLQHHARGLGNRLTLHSPSRGFSMEFGSALTVVMATRLALPISTTQCITGATVGVGLCTGDLKAINWRMVAWIYAGWIVTLPCTGIIAGVLMGIVINAPQWGRAT
ncbi:Na+/Pi symporter [Cryomyces antarcticus]|uniref:Phosphate transporter n=1 Tax=Cryomyces antarcticus TaxID=329879 RepID=A0ABR0LPH0_9PEZI|nr:Na+/Pi symporter [Cryomyces antarcticus]